MTENPFAGSSRDPIALLEQPIVLVGGLNGRMGNLEQGMERLHSRMDRLEKEVASMRADTSRFMASLSREQTNLRAGVEDAIERKGLAVKFEMQDRFADIEKRLAELEEAERRRKEGMGA